MNILGIETSCDETAAAIVQDGHKICSHVVVSSLKEHKKYGGIIPEIASRRQLECIMPVVEKALSDACVKLDQVDAVAVTTSPGLIGSLLVGVSFARALSYAIGKPLIAVDHIKAHLYASFLDVQESIKHFPVVTKNRFKLSHSDFLDSTRNLPMLPAIGLVVSGGHTSLYHIKKFTQFELLGQTRDDAAGEAFDKVARLLKIGYPGGPAIDKLAKRCKHTSLQFKCAPLKGSFDFSFSGIKTAVLYHYRDHAKNKQFDMAEVVYAFQKSVVSILTEKCLVACQKLKIKTLVIGGGVAANSRLRKELLEKTRAVGINLFLPPLELCMDNAAMIAGLGFHKEKGYI